MANQGGEAAAYYNQQPNAPPSGYGAGPQMQYYPQPPDPRQDGHQKGPYAPNQPPPYGHQPYQAPQAGAGPYTFDQAFKVDRPKWNDLWAGILVRPAHPPFSPHHVPLTMDRRCCSSSAAL